MTHCFVTHSCGDVTRILDTENSNATLNKHGYSKCWFQNVHYKQLNNSAIVWVLLYRVCLPIVTTKPSQNNLRQYLNHFKYLNVQNYKRIRKGFFCQNQLCIVMHCNRDRSQLKELELVISPSLCTSQHFQLFFSSRAASTTNKWRLVLQCSYGQWLEADSTECVSRI